MKPEIALAALAACGLAASVGLWSLVSPSASASSPTGNLALDIVGEPMGVPIEGEDVGAAPDEVASAPDDASSADPFEPDFSDWDEELADSDEGVPAPPGLMHHVREGARRREERGAVGERDGDVLTIDFEELELVAYEPPDPEATEAERAARGDVMPELLRAVDGETVSMRGYMSPLEFEGDLVTSFVLSRNMPGCCFGVLPQPDEWVEVDVIAEGGVDYMPFGSIVVTGRFEVGEEFDEYGYLTSLYRIQAESVEEPW